MTISESMLPEEPMAAAAGFCNALLERGFNFCAGVPCSIFKQLIIEFEAHPDMTYIPAVREDTAVGIATGAYSAGKQPVVLMQNSGLGVCLNALTSLSIIYEIPVLLLISWRGYKGNDAPEHLVMGEALPGILDQIGIPYNIPQAGRLVAALDRASHQLEARLPYALIVRKGILQ